jgi:PhnB protein
MQTIYPVIRYQDARAAIDFLGRAFGFTKHFVVDGPGDLIAHAQLRHRGNLIMVGSRTNEPPADKHPAGPAWNYLVVEDADDHHRRAVEAGAEIVMELQDQDYGSREYTATDPEGNLWSFGTYQPDPVRPGATPFLAYEDGPGALEWLARAFGFKELTRMINDGRLAHGEMDTGSGIVMLATPTPDYQSPRRHRDSCDAARRWLSVPWVVDGVLVYVDDLDAHHRRARQTGATILSEPESGPPAPRYRVEDIEGHRWMFMQR